MKEKIILISADGFIREFWKKAKHHKTLIGAYEELENEYKETFGKRKYSDYNSFRVCRDRKTKETMLHKKR
mgnify:FL=1|tara:strand:- start:12828 stop:13040 length:213 start_codon:yes stop_codon:yes gene_type:complete